MNEFEILEKLDKIISLLEGKENDRWISLKEACAYTGLSESTLRRSMYSGRLQSSTSTGKTLFKLQWLDRFLIG